MTQILWEEDLQGGQCWSLVLQRGTALRLTDVEGGANVSSLFYNADHPEERYNLPDTLKAQHIARLTKGFVLFSDMGRVLCSVTDDSVGWHDPIGGILNSSHIRAKYGEKNYQQHRNGWTQSALEGLTLELAKHSLSTRDLTASVNWFSKVQVAMDGSMRYVAENSQPGDFVELRAEMNVLIALSANHHPMESGTVYAPKPVKLTLKRVPAAGPDDPCRISRAENGRGFTLTERYFAYGASA
jgi:urea carboxylase-associated protein 2